MSVLMRRVKGHTQYSLRDPRRDRKSAVSGGSPQRRKVQDPPRIAGAQSSLLELLKRREYRYRYWAKRELGPPSGAVRAELDVWVISWSVTNAGSATIRRALWTYRGLDPQIRSCSSSFWIATFITPGPLRPGNYAIRTVD